MENTYRPSSYLIPIRLEEEKDKYVIVQGYTGAFDVVTANIHSFLRATASFSLEDFPFFQKKMKVLLLIN